MTDTNRARGLDLRKLHARARIADDAGRVVKLLLSNLRIPRREALGLAVVQKMFPSHHVPREL